MNKSNHFGIAVISNPTMRDGCTFKPMVFGKTKLFAVLRQQYYHRLHEAEIAEIALVAVDIYGFVIRNRKLFL